MNTRPEGVMMNEKLDGYYFLAFLFMLFWFAVTVVFYILSFGFGMFHTLFGGVNEIVLLTLSVSPFLLYLFLRLNQKLSSKEVLFFCFNLYLFFELFYALYHGFSLSATKQFWIQFIFIPLEVYVLYRMMEGYEHSYLYRLTHTFKSNKQQH